MIWKQLRSRCCSYRVKMQRDHAQLNLLFLKP